MLKVGVSTKATAVTLTRTSVLAIEGIGTRCTAAPQLKPLPVASLSNRIGMLRSFNASARISDGAMARAR